jgi:hypothetical protein
MALFATHVERGIPLSITPSWGDKTWSVVVTHLAVTGSKVWARARTELLEVIEGN